MAYKYKETERAHLRAYRRRTNNASTHKYEKTPKGFLMRLYRNMQSRITGVQKLKYHLYKGKFLLPRQDFYSWSLDHPKFLELFSSWQTSNYKRTLTPSVNRIDPDKGYELDNMEWITHSDNSRYGSIHKQQMYPKLRNIFLKYPPTHWKNQYAEGLRPTYKSSPQK